MVDEIPTEGIATFCRELTPVLQAEFKRFCDTAYADILENVQDYLCENAEYNIKSKFESQRRSTVTAYKAIDAVLASTDLQEAKDNAYAVHRGFWSEAKALTYRTLAEARAKGQS